VKHSAALRKFIVAITAPKPKCLQQQT